MPKANVTQPRILLVGLPNPLPDAGLTDFYTDKHFLDYDIVIMDPFGALEGQNHNYTAYIHDDVMTLDSEIGHSFQKRYRATTQKLVNFVKKGGTAIIFLRAMPTLEYLDPDNYHASTELSLDGYLPWKTGVIQRAHGSNIEFITQGSIGRFWEATNGLWTYEAVYMKPPQELALAHVRGHPDEVVASGFETTGRGFIFMTPVLNFGNIVGDTKALQDKKESFIKAVQTFYSALRADGTTHQLPEWASDYSLPGEKELRDEISAANGQIEALQQKVAQRTEALNDLSLHKLLVTGYDSALERAVDRVLTEMGLTVEPGPKGRVDRTATYGDRKFAIEVQGVKKGAKEQHARKLTTWVQEVAIEDDKEPKGLLVVNPYRDTPLAERDINSFWPAETIPVCERQGHCAMTGMQLLGLYLDAMQDDKKRDELIEQMFQTEGLFKGYEDWNQFLVPIGGKSGKKG